MEEGKYKQLTEVIKIFEGSDFTTLAVEFDGVRLSISKSGTVSEVSLVEEAPSLAAPTLSKTTAAALSQPAIGGEAPADRPGAKTPAAPAQAALGARVHVVRAPMLGTLYHARSPGEPPFVAEGARVEASDTLCLIECMKLFNTIHAGVSGRLLRFGVENGALIEFDQPIAYIELD
jgi:acetyl-CoA carboxylase biotin carboxyl carrier protein